MSCKYKYRKAPGFFIKCLNRRYHFDVKDCGKSCYGYEDGEGPMDDIKAKFHEYKSNMIKSMEQVLDEKNALEAEIVELQNENRRLSRHRIPVDVKSEIISLCTKIIDEVNE